MDKTEQIFRLITSGSYFFISRPRRFGKSLTLSTIKSIYTGQKHLFEGLWIADQWNWNKIHPVIHIQFNEIGYATNGLEKALYNTLAKQAAKYDLTLSASGYDQQFAELIEKLCEKAGKVVITHKSAKSAR